MARILCSGMAVLDHVFGIDAFPVGGEKFRATGYRSQIGGPATVAALAIARLGGQAALCARLGQDEASAALLRALQAAGVDGRACVVTPGAALPVSSVLVQPDGERQIVNFRGAGLPDGAEGLDPAVLDGAAALLVDPRWPAAAASLARRARALGIPAVVDAENDLEALTPALQAASHIAFSAPGLRALSGTDDPAQGLGMAAGRFDAWLCVTLGAGGVLWHDGGRLQHEPAFAVRAVDTLGAGDVWHGAFALALGEGRAPAEAVRFANAAAAMKCSRGAGPEGLPRRQETEALLQGGALHQDQERTQG